MSGKSQVVRENDVKAMLELMGQVAELHGPTPRLEHALAGISKLIGAEFCFSTRWRSDGPGAKVQPYAILSRGWTDEQLAEGIRVAGIDPFHDYVADDIHEGPPRDGGPSTFVTARLDAERARQRADAAAEFSEALGGDMGIALNTPADQEGHFASLGVIRTRGRSEFDEREIQIARLMWDALRFLHRAPLAAVDDNLWGTKLSPRLSQVLRGIKEGQSSKQIARRLDLSLHTVNDYVKELFRRFGVSSRAELLALWVE